MKEFEEYPYKRIYTTASSLGYPLEVIEELLSYLGERLPREHYKKDVENLLKMVLVSLDYYFDYAYDSRDGLSKSIEEFVSAKESRHTRSGMLARAIEGF